jgi:hypothetical protein
VAGAAAVTTTVTTTVTTALPPPLNASSTLPNKTLPNKTLSNETLPNKPLTTKLPPGALPETSSPALLTVGTHVVASVVASALAADDDATGDLHGPVATLPARALSFTQEKIEIIKRATVRVTVALPQEVRSMLLGRASGSPGPGIDAAAEEDDTSSAITEAGGAEAALDVQRKLVLLGLPRPTPARLLAGGLVLLTLVLVLLRLRVSWSCGRRAEAKAKGMLLELPRRVNAFCTEGRSNRCGADRKDGAFGGAAAARTGDLGTAGLGPPSLEVVTGAAAERIMQLVA